MLLLSLTFMTSAPALFSVEASHHLFFHRATTAAPGVPCLFLRGRLAFVSTEKIVNAESSKSGLTAHDDKKFDSGLLRYKRKQRVRDRIDQENIVNLV